MRSPAIAFLLILTTSFLGCGQSTKQQQPPSSWTTGFWVWNSEEASTDSPAGQIDVIFCHVGDLRKGRNARAETQWSVYGELPRHLPPAHEYWAVVRSDERDLPGPQAAAELVQVMAKLQGQALHRGLRLAGIQLDIDSPTGDLPKYAALLRELRKTLPKDTQISITSLLDWFRSGTSVGEVLHQVDEFVPQFYDVQERGSYFGGVSIASRFTAAKWGPTFNQYKKRYRIGISTFGRARFIARADPSQSGSHSVSVERLKPLDVAINPDFHLEASRTEANDLTLTYKAGRKTEIGYARFDPGDAIQFILSTPDGIRSAVEEAKRMGGYCAGVLFFRWPTFNETLATSPREVLAAAGGVASVRNVAELSTNDGSCAAVSCVDLYLISSGPLAANPIRYVVHSSAEIEYFLPEEKTPVRMTGASQLELVLPPYCGRGRLYLGRAVSAAKNTFTLEQVP